MSETQVWLMDDEGGVHEGPLEDIMLVAGWMNEANDASPGVLLVHDALEVLWLVQARNEVQPIIWPMRLHEHDQDCGRA